MTGISLRIRSPLMILAFLSAAYAMSFFHRACPAVLSVDIMRDFSVDATAFSLISSSTMLGYALTQLPSGVLADIIGGRRTLAIYQLLAGFLCMAFTLSSSFSSAVACRFLLGLMLAGNIPAYKVLALRVAPEKYAQYSVTLTCCGAVGSLLAASPLVALTGLAGWRGALFMAGAFTSILGLCIFVLLRRPPESGTVQPPSVRENVRKLREGIGIVVRMRQFWLYFIWFMLVVGNMFALVTMWWGPYLMQGNGLSREVAGLSISIMSLAPLPLALIVPALSEKVFHSRRIFLVAASVVQAAAFGFILINGGRPLSFACLTALGLMVTLSTSALGCLFWTMVKESMPVSALASACGFLNTSGPVSAALIQSVFGFLVAGKLEAGMTAAEAYSEPFLIPLVGSLASLVAVFFMKDTLGGSHERS